MEPSIELNHRAQPTTADSQAPQSSTPPPRLSVDFGWRKFKSLLSDENTPNAEPLYILEYQLAKKRLKFKRYATGEVFGVGNLNVFSIDADYEVHGRKDQIVAQSRLKTSYAHRSTAASTTDKPITLTWSSDSNFTTWDFVCCDEQQLPVAKLTMNIWGLKKIARIEFMGVAEQNLELQEELVVTTLTLSYQMALRTGNLLNLVGALFARPGHEPKASGPGRKTAPFSSPRASVEIGQSETPATAQLASGTDLHSAI
ncbi:hypothetical protein N7533_007520 [Penicillium manginii]|jgi:hypothetical protein|uniref:uncharacterized protein n=1 Tax=Penicillium manginii TaxID=203109 RepID=UPI002548B904|nr:uncharacterized protein N7533_007520 [Penicillium manginii]KAJ5750492.1 hypothetical protein N7533_007520 [Penicillium manginii]